MTRTQFRPSVFQHVAMLLAAGLLILLLTAGSAAGQADNFLTGDGHEGSFTAGAGSTTLSSVAPVTGSTASSVTIGAIRNGTAAYSALAGFETNRLVLIVQSTNFTGTALSGSQIPLDISADQVGRWELARIASIAGSTVNFSAPLINSYASTGAQIVSVPEFTSATIAAGRTLSALNWDGTSGGIIAFLATGSISASGSVTASALGFRGGVRRDTTASGCAALDGGDSNRKGEGFVPSFYGTGGTGSNNVGYGNKTNGGGGGNCADSGGGGGSNAGLAGKGGTTYANESGGGTRDVGGRGGQELAYSLYDHMTFGGGGGSGDGNSTGNSNGGNGGGIVWLRGGSLTGAGTFSANGANAADSTDYREGSGGGGAGGAVILRFGGTVACTSVSVTGGNGGNLPGNTGNTAAGPGGGASGGRVLLQGSTVSCASAVSNGVAGTLSGGTGDRRRGATPTATNDPAASAPVDNPGAPLAAPTSALSAPANGLTTNDTTPTFSGTATANSSVAVYVDGVLLGTATASGAGAWSYTPLIAIGNGSHSAHVIPTHLGITGSASNSNSFTIDTLAPAAPVITNPPGDLTTSDNTPSISGTAEANSTITVYSNAAVIGSANVDGTGNWTFPSPGTAPDGTYSITVRAIDAANNQGPLSATLMLTVDTILPAVTITAPSAAQFVNDTTPNVSFSVVDATTTSTTCSFDGAPATACSSPHTASSLAEGAHSVTVTATDAAGNVGTSVRNFTVDSIPPLVAVSAPAESQNLNTATPSISFGVTESNPGTITCSTDGGTFNPCSTPFVTNALSDGAHNVAVRAIDAAGNTTTETRSFNIDTLAPAAPVITSPSGALITSDTTPSFGGSAEANSIVTVRDGAAALGTATADGSGNWTFTPATSLTEGAHAITATATDVAGNQGVPSAARAVTIDTTAPLVGISSPTEGALLSNNTPAIAFSATDASATTTQCSVDGEAFATCVSPFTTATLADGAHAVDVRATDAAGNQSTATRNFIVDATAPAAPNITVPSGPIETNDATPTVSGTADPNIPVVIFDGGVSIGATPSDGSGNWSFTFASALSEGPHTITAKSTDTAGNDSPMSTARVITIDTALPAISIAAPAAGQTLNDSTPDVSFSVTDAGAVVIACAVDGGGFAPCNSPFATVSLGDGTHSVAVQATDAAGNVSTGVVNFVIDTVAPVTTIDSGPPALTVSDAATFTFSANEVGATFECRTDGGSWNSCTSPTSYNALADGSRTFEVRATDPVGNVEATPQSFSWTIDSLAPDAPEITSPAVDLTTSDTTPSLSGSAEFNATVTILDGGVAIGTTTADAAGNWSFALGSALNEGPHTITATSTDAVGNESASSTARVVTIDTTAPTIDIASPTEGQLLTDDTPTITFGTTDATATTTECSVDGAAFSACSSPLTTIALADGARTVAVRATDAAGNQSTATRNFTIDATAPDAAIILVPAGALQTNDTTPTISGTAEANATVTIYDGAVAIGTTSVDSSGAWSFTPSTALSEGVHPITATATDTGGHEGSPSAARVITIDTTAPLQPAITTPAESIVTSDQTPTISGTAEADSTISIFDGVVAIGVATTDGSGNWTFTPLTPLSPGAHNFSVTAADSQGNTSAASAARQITVDVVPPALAITSPSEGQAVNDHTPAITFTVTDDTSTTVTCAVDGSAAISCSSPFASAQLSDGLHSVTVEATDAAGNVSTRTINFTVDTTAPETVLSGMPLTIEASADASFVFSSDDAAASFECRIDTATWSACSSPAVYLGLADGTHDFGVRAVDAAGNPDATPAAFNWTVDTLSPLAPDITSPGANLITSDVSPSLLGDAEPNATVRIFDGATQIGEVLADGAGDWSFTITPDLNDGPHVISAIAIDAAGNQSPASPARTMTVDTQDPSVAITAPIDGQIFNNSQPTIDFSASDDTAITVECSFDGGAFAPCLSPLVSSTLGDGAHYVTVRATDAAGNAGQATSNFSVDTTAPITAITSSPAADDSSNDPAFTFTADQPGSTFECQIDGAGWVACSSPESYDDLGEGAHTFEVRATDSAGNTEALPQAFSWNIDTIAPAAPIISSPADPALSTAAVHSLTGTAEANSTVTIFDGAFALGATLADAAGNWSFTTGALPSGLHNITSTASDSAGNGSAASNLVRLTIDQTAPQTTLDSTPIAMHNSSTAVFEFSSNESGATFECSVDNGPFTACTSPLTITALGEGAHEIAVRAIDPAGNVESAPATFNWSVDTEAPTGTVDKRPDTGPPGTSPTFDIATPDSTATVTCSIDGGPFVACSSPFTPGSLTAGQHDMSVRFTDPAGNSTTEDAQFTITAIPIPPTPTTPTPPAPAPVTAPTAPAPDVNTCPSDDAAVPAIPAVVNVNGVSISRKTLLKFKVSSDQFIIARVTVKQGRKKVGSAARAIAKGKRQVVMKVRKLPKNSSLPVRLSAVSLSGGKSVADATLVVDRNGKVSIAPASGAIGNGSSGASAVACGKEPGAPRLKVKTSTDAKVRIGMSKLRVTASTSQFAVATFQVIQGGIVIGRKVYVMKPGTKLRTTLKLLGKRKLARGKATLKVSVFSVDGIRVKQQKTFRVK